MNGWIIIYKLQESKSSIWFSFNDFIHWINKYFYLILIEISKVQIQNWNKLCHKDNKTYLYAFVLM